jgi:hypothetical protein
MHSPGVEIRDESATRPRRVRDETATSRVDDRFKEMLSTGPTNGLGEAATLPSRGLHP